MASAKGVFLLSTVMRRSEGKQYSAEMINDIQGTPANPVPGVSNRRIPAFAKKVADETVEKQVFMPATVSEQQVRAAYI